jgi:hypothetical protein
MPYLGWDARTGRCRVPIVREGGRADNGCSVNWAGGGVANSFLRRTLSPRLHSGITQEVAPNESQRAPKATM